MSIESNMYLESIDRYLGRIAESLADIVHANKDNSNRESLNNLAVSLEKQNKHLEKIVETLLNNSLGGTIL